MISKQFFQKESNVHTLDCNDETPIDVFFRIILPPFGLNEEQIEQKIQTARALEVFNVYSLRYFAIEKEKLQEKFSVPVAVRILEVLHAEKNEVSSEPPHKRAKADRISPFLYRDAPFSNRLDFHINQESCPQLPQLSSFQDAYRKHLGAKAEESFVTNFLDAMQQMQDLPKSSLFNCPPICWTKREEDCCRKLIKWIFYAEQSRFSEISSILVGMKGVGKTTLIRKICIVAGALSDTLFVTYYDLTHGVLLPMEILLSAMQVEEPNIEFSHIEHIIDAIKSKKRNILTVIDEAQKYYVHRTADDGKFHSKRAVSELYTLGTSPGSCCIICGSSSTLVDLALQRTLTPAAVRLQESYEPTTSLNHQKFRPYVLPLIERSELKNYLEFLGRPFSEQDVTDAWLQSNGSVRGLSYREQLWIALPEGFGYAILVWLYNEQPDKEDVTKLKKISIEAYYRRIKYWSDNDILHVPDEYVTMLIDECVLAASWNEIAQIVDIGFGNPNQFLKLRDLERLPDELPLQEKHWFLDPKTYGEMLEWVVVNCLQKSPVTQKFVLCLNNKASNMSYVHDDVFLNKWDPMGKHLGAWMKIFPDDYGIDMIKVTVQTPANNQVELHQCQIKLGGSYLSPGSGTDTLDHLLACLKESPRITKYLQQRLPKYQIKVRTDVYATRQIAESNHSLFQQAGVTLFHRQLMYEQVWSPAVKKYANDACLDWITKLPSQKNNNNNDTKL